VNTCLIRQIVIRSVVFVAACSVVVCGLIAAEPDYLVYVSNERSGDISIIDPAEGKVIGTVPVGKRPRGIHCSPDGTKVFIAVTGSPRQGPGIDHARPAYDTSADGIVVFDAIKRAAGAKLPANSDPEQFAILKDGRRAVISNEDKAGASVIDLTSGEVLGQVKVSDEPEGVAVNPANGRSTSPARKKAKCM
jgi:YVTN family beta-propeller protein